MIGVQNDVIIILTAYVAANPEQFQKEIPRIIDQRPLNRNEIPGQGQFKTIQSSSDLDVKNDENKPPKIIKIITISKQQIE